MNDVVWFAIMVDGEVVHNIPIPNEPEFSKPIAVYRSNPVFMEVPGPITEGLMWDGTTFAPPAE